MNEHACADVDPETFFGPADSSAGSAPFGWELRALDVCGVCRVVEPCLDAALKHPVGAQHGVVGGMTASQRRVELATRRARAATGRARALAVQRGRSVDERAARWAADESEALTGLAAGAAAGVGGCGR